MKPKTTESNDTKTVVIKSSHGHFRIIIPKEATLTFGGLIPGAKCDGGANRTALRVYIKKEQIAVFTEVVEWRVMDTVTVLKKKVATASKQVQAEENGVLKARMVHVTTEEWVDPDVVQDEPQDERKAIKDQVVRADGEW